jgi:hypothetical protein
VLAQRAETVTVEEEKRMKGCSMIAYIPPWVNPYHDQTMMWRRLTDALPAKAVAPVHSSRPHQRLLWIYQPLLQLFA